MLEKQLADMTGEFKGSFAEIEENFDIDKISSATNEEFNQCAFELAELHTTATILEKLGFLAIKFGYADRANNMKNILNGQAQLRDIAVKQAQLT